MEHFPKEFYCPISQCLMKDPVIGKDGQTYERESIIEWLRIHGTSPLTRSPMDVSELIPNYALKGTIELSLRTKGCDPDILPPVFPLMPPALITEIPLELKINTLKMDEKMGTLTITVNPPSEGARKPCCLICILDTSGSMNESGSIEKVSESDNFSRLDLVKHSVKTVANMLTPDDYLAIISFSNSANVVMGIQQMSPEGKLLAVSSVDALQAESGTNLWDGLRVALQMAKENPIIKSLNTCMWVFTDGEPNLNPPRGVVDTLIMFMGGNEADFTIHTFGYGYNLESRTLVAISEIGNGCFCYLPDSNLVGTTFINCLCNTLATITNRARITVKCDLPEGALHPIGFKLKNGKIEVGPIQYGQQRSFVFEFPIPEISSFHFLATLSCDGKENTKNIEGFIAEDPLLVYREYCRSKMAELIIDGLDMRYTGKGDPNFLQTLEKMITGLPCKDDERIKALLKDLVGSSENEGRIGKAFSTPERIKRWGKHYIRSLARAHSIQLCHNYKDPGVQLYGGKLFKELQVKAEAIFCNLPPPTATKKPVAHAVVAAPEPPNASVMQEYIGGGGGGGGCFDGDGIVKLNNQEKCKKVKDLKKGDCVINRNGELSKVICLIMIGIHRKIKIASINGVILTLKHPVKINGIWKKPMEIISSSEEKYMEYLYNLVLDGNHTVEINGVECATFGHGYKDNEIVEHSYYGTERVIMDLKKMEGWNEGKIIWEKSRKIRDPATGKVIGIV